MDALGDHERCLLDYTVHKK